jgi:hypothetical protein
VVAVGIQLSPQWVVRRKGAAVKKFKGGRLPVTFYLESHDGAWRVARLERSA